MPRPQSRSILHVDMDAFYASVEQRDDPSLKGRPVIVGGTGGRGVVAAASYEVRRFGVRSAMPMREALRRCPDAICVRPRMSHYQEVSRQIFAVFARFTPLVEGLSLDEAFLDVTASVAALGPAEAIAAEIKRRVMLDTALTCSVGVAPNKLVAKIASDLRKPDGLVVVPPSEIGALLDPLPVGRLFGIGPKTAPRVEALGIRMVMQAMDIDESRMDFDCSATSDRIRGEITVDSCVLNARKLAEVKFTAQMTAVDDSFWRGVDDGDERAGPVMETLGDPITAGPRSPQQRRGNEAGDLGDGQVERGNTAGQLEVAQPYAAGVQRQGHDQVPIVVRREHDVVRGEIESRERHGGCLDIGKRGAAVAGDEQLMVDSGQPGHFLIEAR